MGSKQSVSMDLEPPREDTDFGGAASSHGRAGGSPSRSQLIAELGALEEEIREADHRIVQLRRRLSRLAAA